MKTKTKLLFCDSLFLLYWLFAWAMILFAIWDWGVFIIGQFIILMPAICIFRPKNYKFGKVRGLIVLTAFVLWFVTFQICRALKIDGLNFSAFPVWLKLVSLLVFVCVTVVIASKIYQDTKFSVDV